MANSFFRLLAALSLGAALLCAVSCKCDSRRLADIKLRDGESVLKEGRNIFTVDRNGVVRRINPDRKDVYLVFTAHFSTDDNGYFENFDGIEPVLDVLGAKGVKGSFFPTGNCFRVDRYKPFLRRILDEGHYLSHHSDRHLLLSTEDGRDSTLVPSDSLKADFAAVEAELTALGLGKKQFDWMIPPYEHCNAETADMMRSCGYSLVCPSFGFSTGGDWISTESRSYKTAAQTLERVWKYEEENGLDGCVILVHPMIYPVRDVEEHIFYHLEEMIDTLKARGYGFKTFKNL